MIALIDTRTCVIDSIAESLRNALDSRTITVSRMEDLTRANGEFKDNAKALIVYCDGAVHGQDTVDRDIRNLHNAFPSTKIVLLTDRLQLLSLSNFHQNILNGVIPSSYTTDQLVACISAVLSGVAFLPHQLLDQHHISIHHTNGTTGAPCEKLTPRQHQIMQYITIGRSNKYIAAELSLSESTVKVHVHEAMKRLGATSRTHASYILANNDICADS